MLYADKIYEGLSVELIVNEGEYRGKYRTRIEEVGKRILSIGVPIVEGQFMPLREGTRLEVVFCDNLTAYAFSSVIIKRIAGSLPSFIIEFPSKIKKIQRRKYVRVPVVNPIKYQIIEKEGLSDEKQGYTIDLSGGGILFKADEKIPEKTLLFITMRLFDGEIQVPAKVTRCVKQEDKNFYKISVEFQEISERVRDKIVGYVFRIQREMRQKGLV